jgi:hypothetical protein
MSKDGKSETVDRGGASQPTREERDREFAGITGNAETKGEDPSPAGRARGETSGADEAAPVDLDSAHDRAS